MIGQGAAVSAVVLIRGDIFTGLNSIMCCYKQLYAYILFIAMTIIMITQTLCNQYKFQHFSYVNTKLQTFLSSYIATIVLAI